MVWSGRCRVTRFKPPVNEASPGLYWLDATAIWARNACVTAGYAHPDLCVDAVQKKYKGKYTLTCGLPSSSGDLSPVPCHKRAISTMMRASNHLFHLLTLTSLVVAQRMDPNATISSLHNDQGDGVDHYESQGYMPLTVPFVDGHSNSGAPENTSMRRHSNSKVFFYDENHEVVAFIDQAAAQARIFPDYGALKPLTAPADIKGVFVDLEHQGSAFPPDDTRIELVEGSSLLGSEGVLPPTEGYGTVARRWNDAGNTTYLTLGTVRRFVESNSAKIPVCGPGSQASFGVGHENKLVSLSYQWRAAKKACKKRKPLPANKVLKQIDEALEKYRSPCRSVRIKTIDLCMYDSGARYIQPVYRVIAEPFDPSKNSTTSVKQILEYIPFGGDAIEPILPPGQAFSGVDGDEQALQPNTVDISKRSLLNYFDARNSKLRITVGRYVVRNDSDGFVEDARNFWSNLAPSTIYEFVRKGFFWAYPRLYNKDANFFVNDVNVALTEAHGKFHGFTTYDATAAIDFVNIPSDLAPGGFGPISNGGKGQLGYWFIDACEVMPTLTDFEAIKDPNPQGRTFDPWWPVFRGGIHAVLSWRTSALFADNTAASAAQEIALGRPVVQAWLDAAQADPAYRGRPTYVGGGTGLADWPFGRAAAIFRCGRIGDKVSNLENLGAPTCLSARWWNNN
ncbi:hypothetical protein FA13DRAFT_1771327 [Coprinellus micaceus]|uniref:Uncharacterized protein n=1 Tax=Coprinellus micaceus TaxID=71717 RepID=A0A4Y7TRR6_COPMI|nr:hypothetical protein FA13DRAFT_1771327 [Coprinellus micaceus]